MADDFERWFTDPHFGEGEEDWFVVLGSIEHTPRLIAQVDDASHCDWKRQEAVIALLQIMEDCTEDARLSLAQRDQIHDSFRRNRRIAEQTIPDAAHTGEIVLRMILGMPLPEWCTQQDLEHASRAGAPERHRSR